MNCARVARRPAMRSAAAGWAWVRAAAAIAASRSGLVSKLVRAASSLPGASRSDSSSRRAAPALTISSALRRWWSSAAAAKGTSRAGLPAAANSATVEAPLRAMTSVAWAKRAEKFKIETEQIKRKNELYREASDKENKFNHLFRKD